MMLMPRRNFDLFDDDFFRDDFFNAKGKNNYNLMKTDIQEKDIKIDVTDGYLTINAKANHEEKEEKNNYVRRERFSGECTRSFFVGEDVEVDSIKASFKNGILSLEVPKEDPEKKSPEKKYVEISD